MKPLQLLYLWLAWLAVPACFYAGRHSHSQGFKDRLAGHEKALYFLLDQDLYRGSNAVAHADSLVEIRTSLVSNACFNLRTVQQFIELESRVDALERK